MENTLKIAIYGAGAMGTVLGAFLSKSGVAVDMVCRNKAHVSALKERGATVRYLENGEEKFLCAQVNALLPEEMSSGYDVVFLMTKQRENEKIALFLKEKLSEKGIVCTTQNGLPEEGLSKILGKEKVYGAALTWGATRTGNGEVMLTSELSAMSLSVGGYRNSNEMAGALGEILKSVQTVNGNENFLTVTDNLAGARWSKLTINAAFSGLSVVTGLTFGEIAKRRKTKRLALKILHECFDVASAQGVKLAPLQGHDLQKLLGGKGFFKKQISLFLLPFAIKKHKRLTSGMLKDVQEGKRCDIDYICGVVTSLGDEYGVDTPTLDTALEIVHGIENGLYEISVQNTDFFE